MITIIIILIIIIIIINIISIIIIRLKFKITKLYVSLYQSKSEGTAYERVSSNIEMFFFEKRIHFAN